jgi:mono/diheme cytochrome c family protein
MHRTFLFAIFSFYLSACFAQPSGGVPVAPKDKDQSDFFETRVRPVLAKNCYACHTQSKMGGLQLDSHEHLMAGGKDGPVVVPGDAEASVLIQAVRQTHERFKMPPAAQLPEQEINDLAAWVKAGAVWPESAAVQPAAKGSEYVIRPDQRAFWSFQLVHKPAIPKVKDTSWPHNDIDRFILAKLEEKGLRPVRPADKQDLIRRATFDLIGLPPTPEEVEAFLNDKSPNAFGKVVDRLLASPQYGERWARHWLDFARYSDEKLSHVDGRYPNAYRYRDWVIQAFNDDMPYDLFVKAQIAADLLPVKDRDKLLPGLGFYAMSPQGENQEDRVDVTTRTFLGLTVACARCHDHKYDPIPTKDFYSLQGIFNSTEFIEIPLAPQTVVDRYQRIKKQIDQQKTEINDFISKQAKELSGLLAAKSVRYMLAAQQVIGGADAKAVAEQEKLDQVTLERWMKYLKAPKEHPYLKAWDDAVQRGTTLDLQRLAEEFQHQVDAIFAEQRQIEDRNYVKLGGAEGSKETVRRQSTSLESLEIKKYYLWRDLASEPYSRDGFNFIGGIYFYSPKDIDRWLQGEWKDRLVTMRANLAALEKQLPSQYAFLHGIKDADHPANMRVQIRGEEDNLGEEAPRRFLQILSDGETKPFTQGSGRLELAEAIARASNPLTARVLVNRIWERHFGQGIVRTPSNFGQMGDRPTHPELLNYLAARLVENHWSIKALHREIVLSAAYQLSTNQIPSNAAQDPDNRLIWRANMVQRLEIEALRDAILSVSGTLDLTMGGPASRLTDDNHRRTVYGVVSRNRQDPALELFDFPNPSSTIEHRPVTVGPLQRLYFMNNSFITLQSKALAKRLESEASNDEARITRAYLLLYSRKPTGPEIQIGRDFLRQTNQAWPSYAQALLTSSEFSTVN